MVGYRRNYVPGGTFFFTVTLRDRKSSHLIDYIHELRTAFKESKAKLPFDIVALVVMPEHFHMIVTLPEGDNNYSSRIRLIKSKFTRALLKKGISLSKNKRGEYDLWQSRFWEHTINSEKDLNNHIEYVHWNPVKHGWVERVSDWPYSSFHRYVRNEIVTENWGGVFDETAECDYGE